METSLQIVLGASLLVSGCSTYHYRVVKPAKGKQFENDFEIVKEKD